MGCCMSKKGDSGADAATPRPATPPQQAIITDAPGPASHADNTRAASPHEAETAAVASAVARTLADTDPSGAASPHLPTTAPNIPNEHYFLPPTVFVPDEPGQGIDFFRTEEQQQQGQEPAKKDENEQQKKKGSSSSSSSSSSSAKSGGAKSGSAEN